jgi:hypothetical protein
MRAPIGTRIVGFVFIVRPARWLRSLQHTGDSLRSCGHRRHVHGPQHLQGLLKLFQGPLHLR